MLSRESLTLLIGSAIDAHLVDAPTWWQADDDEIIIGNSEIAEVLRRSDRPLIRSVGKGKRRPIVLPFE